MVNIFQSTRCLTLATYLATAAFATVTICPPPLMAAQEGINFNDINFAIKIEKIYEKVKRAIDKGETNKIVGYMFDFKSEVEQYTGKKVDINKQIDIAQKEALKKGQKVDDKYIKAIKKELNKHDNKYKHRVMWFAQCSEVGFKLLPQHTETVSGELPSFSDCMQHLFITRKLITIWYEKHI